MSDVISELETAYLQYAYGKPQARPKLDTFWIEKSQFGPIGCHRYSVERNSEKFNSAIVNYDFKVRLQKTGIVALDKYLSRCLRRKNDFSTEVLDKISASQAKPIIKEMRLVKKSKLTEWAKRSEYMGNGSSQHLICQHWFLQNVKNVIAVEVPSISKTHSCHTDFLSVDGRYIYIWDLKPKIHKEDPFKMAAQLFYNRECLVFQTGLPREMFRMSCFDENSEFRLIG